MKATTGYRVRTEEEGNKLFGRFEDGFPLQSVFPSQHRASHQTDFLSELVLRELKGLRMFGIFKFRRSKNAKMVRHQSLPDLLDNVSN